MTPEAWQHLKHFFFLLLALLALALGVLGVFIPGLPTTPFILLAAWSATRSSPRLRHWLESHSVFGDIIRNWQAGGTVSRKAKWSATIVMGFCAIILLAIASSPRLPIFGIASMTIVLLWLWRRPEPKPDE